RSAVDRGGTIVRIIVKERAAAVEFVLHVRKAPGTAASLIDIVLAANVQFDAISARHDNAGRPYLDIEFNRLPGSQRLNLIMGVIGPVERAECLVELAVRCPEPA